MVQQALQPFMLQASLRSRLRTAMRPSTCMLTQASASADFLATSAWMATWLMTLAFLALLLHADMTQAGHGRSRTQAAIVCQQVTLRMAGAKRARSGPSASARAQMVSAASLRRVSLESVSTRSRGCTTAEEQDVRAMRDSSRRQVASAARRTSSGTAGPAAELEPACRGAQMHYICSSWLRCPADH